MMKTRHDEVLAAIETIYDKRLGELEAKFKANEADWWEKEVLVDLALKAKGFREGYLVGYREGIRLGHDAVMMEAVHAREERENLRCVW